MGTLERLRGTFEHREGSSQEKRMRQLVLGFQLVIATTLGSILALTNQGFFHNSF